MSKQNLPNISYDAYTHLIGNRTFFGSLRSKQKLPTLMYDIFRLCRLVKSRAQISRTISACNIHEKTLILSTVDNYKETKKMSMSSHLKCVD